MRVQGWYPDPYEIHDDRWSPSGDAAQVTTAFLRAWSNGAIGEAADLTDDPAAAQAALTAYGQDLYLRKLTDRGPGGQGRLRRPGRRPGGQDIPRRLLSTDQ